MVDEALNHTTSSGNVFADAGLPDADERLARAAIMHRVVTLIKARGLTQREASALLDIPQPHVSLLLRGRMSSFSLERLLHMLMALGTDVTISYRPSSLSTGRLTITDDQPIDTQRASSEKPRVTVAG